MSDRFSSELWREMENSIRNNENEEEEEEGIENKVITVKYQIVPGLRDGSQIMWAFEENQLYYKNTSHASKKQGTIGYSCRVKDCTSRVHVNPDKSAFRDATDKHTHGSQYAEFKKMYCENKMKERAKSAPASMKPYDIFMDVVVEWQNDPMCNGPYPKVFDEVKKTISNIRKNRYGKNPTNGAEVLAAFEREQVMNDYGFSLLQARERFFDDVVIKNEFENVMFKSAKSIALILENVPESERFFTLDGTFRITPKGVWQQTLILHANYGKKSFPLVYVLMTKRTIAAYENVFRYIHEKLIPLRGKAIIIDFEKAMRKGLIKVLKSIGSTMEILGCWFHFCQALRRKISQMPQLFEKIGHDEKYKDIFRRFQCLPLLPLDSIEAVFRDLAKEALLLDKISFAPFVDYFHKEWMTIVKPKHFCVHKSSQRTTGNAESCNGKLNQIFKAHPGFYLFCETLQKFEVSQSNQLMNYVNGTQQKTETKQFYMKRSEQIEKLSNEYSGNPKLLLKLLANQKNKLLYAENEIQIDKESAAIAAAGESYGLEDDDNIQYTEVIDSDEARSRISSNQTNSESEPLLALNYSGFSDDEDISNGSILANTAHQVEESSKSREKSRESDEGFLTQDSTEAEPEKKLTRSRKQHSMPSTSKGGNTDDSDDSSDEASPLEYFSRNTRNGNAVAKLMVRIKRVMDDDEEVNADSLKCIICCDKKKSVILLPCRHQHTCDACWALWCVQCMSKIQNVSLNESDETKPTCPLCKCPVDDAISAIN